MDLSIIIVSFNTKLLTTDCLKSVYSSLSHITPQLNFEVILVDNHSSDGTVRALEGQFPKLKIIKNDRNEGFARANNKAIKMSHGSVVLLLNSDTVVNKDSIMTPYSFMKGHSDVGVVGVSLLNSDRSIQYSYGSFPTLIRVFLWMMFIDDLPIIKSLIKPYHGENGSRYQSIQLVDWVTGAFFLISKKTIQEVGLMDESIFMYGEEVEWCYRIHKKGFEVYYVPTQGVIHYKGASAKGSVAGIEEEFVFIKKFYLRHFSRLTFMAVRILLKTGAFLRFMLFGIIGTHSQRKEIYAKLVHTI